MKNDRKAVAVTNARKTEIRISLWYSPVIPCFLAVHVKIMAIALLTEVKNDYFLFCILSSAP